MKNVIKVLAIIATLSLTCAAMAQDATTQPAASPSALKGKVSKVEGMVITITSKGTESTVTTDASTTFTLNGQPATLADVKAGERLTATASTGVATQVTLTTAKKKNKKAGATPTTSPAAN